MKDQNNKNPLTAREDAVMRMALRNLTSSNKGLAILLGTTEAIVGLAWMSIYQKLEIKVDGHKAKREAAIEKYSAAGYIQQEKPSGDPGFQKGRGRPRNTEERLKPSASTPSRQRLAELIAKAGGSPNANWLPSKK
jgi:DNA-binding CsgD family transcriptional regulator